MDLVPISASSTFQRCKQPEKHEASDTRNSISCALNHDHRERKGMFTFELAML